jgi:hypothetical protein
MSSSRVALSTALLASAAVALSALVAGPRVHLSATLVAVKPGSISVEAGWDLACFHLDDPCLRPVQGWSVMVRVTRLGRPLLHPAHKG